MPRRRNVLRRCAESHTIFGPVVSTAGIPVRQAHNRVLIDSERVAVLAFVVPAGVVTLSLIGRSLFCAVSRCAYPSGVGVCAGPFIKNCILAADLRGVVRGCAMLRGTSRCCDVWAAWRIRGRRVPYHGTVTYGKATNPLFLYDYENLSGR